MNYIGVDEFCDSPFWNSSLLLDNWWPQFTTCFIHTILVWVPCGYVWLLLPYFLYDVNNKFSTNNLHPPKFATNWKHESLLVDNKGRNITEKSESDQFEQSPRGKFTALCIMKIVMTFLLALMSMIQLLFDARDHQSASVITHSTAYLVTYMLIGFELWFERRKCRIAMFIPFYFYFMNICASVIPLYTWIITENNSSHTHKAILLNMNLGINIVCLVLTFLPDNPIGNTKGYQQIDDKICPEVLASYPSRLLFLWLLPLIRTAVKKEITSDDVFDLNPRDQGRILNPMFARYWEEEVDRVSRINASMCSHTTVSQEHNGNIHNEIDTHTHKKNEGNNDHTSLTNDSDNTRDTKNDHENTLLFKKGQYKFFGTWDLQPKIQAEIPNLFRVLWRLVGKNVCKSLTQKIIADILVFSGPLTLGLLIVKLQNPNEKTIWQAYALCIVLLVTFIVRSVIFVQSRYECALLAIHVRTVLASAIYKKALSMSNPARNSYPVGQIVNLLSVDCQRLQEYLVEFVFMITGSVRIVASLVLLYLVIGPAMVAGVCTLLLTAPFNAWILRRLKSIQETLLKLKDKRSKMISEVLHGMKVLKLYAWEDEFKKKVETIRSQEIKQLYKVAVIYGISEVIMSITPFLCGALTFVTYILIDSNNILDPKTAFVSMAFFNLLRVSALILKSLMTHLTQIFVSVKRINKLLIVDDLDFSNTHLKPEAVEATISLRRNQFIIKI